MSGAADPAMAISIESLTVVRGRSEVLHELTCSVRRGSVTGLLGPSGSGKTTLMRAVVGVQIVRSGTVTVLGRTAGDAALRARVGYVTQAPSVYADLTVGQNARYFASVAGAATQAADAALDRVGMTDFRNRLVSDLSGGQRSRASLACALVGSPDLLVLDEPTVGLDPVIRAELWAFFHELAATGTTLLVSSHVMDEAGRCDRLLLMREGRIIADDTPAAIRTRTGTDDLEASFLQLIRAGGGAP